MTYSEQVRHPSGAFDPPQSGRAVNWRRLLIGLGILGMVAFVLIAIFRPQWLAKIGVHVNLSGANKVLGGVPNPHGWV